MIRRQILVGILALGLLTAAVRPSGAAAADWGWAYEGMAGEESFVVGFRTGPSFMTQSSGTSTAGPNVNFLGMYSVNKWFRVGMMLDWENHGVKGPGSGSLNTVTFLPAVLEYRPGHFGPLIPYVSTGIGLNINDYNVSDSFAWRTAGGIDFALTNWFPNAPPGLMLNTEAAWKRNRVDGADFSTLNWLFGIRYGF